MSWENDWKTNLKDLDVPEHGPDFWVELERKLVEERTVDHGAGTRSRRWRAPAAMVAVLAAFTVVLTVALPNSLVSTVLAYSYSPGAYSYELSYLAVTELEATGEGPLEMGPDSRTEAEGTLTYTVAAGPTAETKTIGIRADVTAANNLDGPFVDIPEVRMVIDADGRIVDIVAPTQGVPGFMLPEPFPGGSSLYSGLPFGFGPPFPDHPLGLGDTWTTNGPMSQFAPDGPQMIALHEVLREESVAGRDTLVIRSVYEVPAASLRDPGESFIEAVFGPVRAEVTVWFDKSAGIIIRAELNWKSTSESRHESGQVLTSIGQTETVIELSNEG